MEFGDNIDHPEVNNVKFYSCANSYGNMSNSGKYQAGNMRFLLNGARMTVPEWAFVYSENPGAPNSFTVASPSSLLEAGVFLIATGSIIAFEIPAKGFDATPVQISGNAHFDADSRFVIRAADFLGRQTLVEAANILLRENSGDTHFTQGELTITLPDPSYPMFTADLPPNRVAKITLTPQTLEVRISPTPTLFMVR